MRHGSVNGSNESPFKLHVIRVYPKTSKTNASFISMVKVNESRYTCCFYISNTFISGKPG